MSARSIADLVVGLIALAVLINDTRAGFLLVFSKRTPLIFAAWLGFVLLRTLPSSVGAARLAAAQDTYERRRKHYGLVALIGGPWLIFLLLLWFWASV